MSRLHAFDLLKLGINVDCLPVLDVPVEGASDVIGNRAYGKNPEIVTQMGRAASDGAEGRRHAAGDEAYAGPLAAPSPIPIHDLPVVDTPLDELRATTSRPSRPWRAR